MDEWTALLIAIYKREGSKLVDFNETLQPRDKSRFWSDRHGTQFGYSCNGNGFNVTYDHWGNLMQCIAKFPGPGNNNGH